LQKTDDMLISEIRDGHLKAFDELMQQHQKQVYHVAYSYTKNEDHALDITQNVFLKVYENLHKFRGQSQFKTWMLRIAYNESNNWIKKNKHNMTLDNPDIVASADDQESNYLAQENRVHMLRCLYNLNTRYRLAVILRYFENYSVREIAAVLKCNEGVVKNMLFRSMQKLKNALQKEHKENVQ
jgi:RNA polymerase sigma-70 factor (ECF subfamily)